MVKPHHLSYQEWSFTYGLHTISSVDCPSLKFWKRFIKVTVRAVISFVFSSFIFINYSEHATELQYQHKIIFIKILQFYLACGSTKWVVSRQVPAKKHFQSSPTLFFRYFSILRDCQLWRHLHQHQSKYTILPHFCHSFRQLTLSLMSSSEVSWSWLTKYKCWKIQAWNKECSVVVILTHTDSAGNFLRKTFFFGHGSLNTWFLHPLNLNHLIVM